jgi:hypothetical protein
MCDQGAAEKKNNGKTTYICASSQKKVRTCLLFLGGVFGRFSVRGLRKHKETNEYFSKITGEIFSAEIFFRMDLISVSFDFFSLRWLSASR